MKRLLCSHLSGLLIIGAVAVRGASPPAIGESQKARELNNIASLYFERGDLAQAEAMFSQAASMGEPEAALNLASILRTEGRYAEAEQSARRALELREQAAEGPGGERDNAKIAATLNLLGMVTTLQGRPGDAAAYLQRALTAAERDSTANRGALADILVNLGNAERLHGDLGNAQAHLQRALTLSQGEESVRTAAALNGMSLTARARGDFKQARTLGTRAVQTLRAAAGPEHPDYAASLANLAMIDQDLHDDRKARDLLVEALRIDQQKLGPDHPRIGVDLNNLGVVSTRLRDYASAESYFLRALEAEGKRNPGSAQLALWTANLASLYSRQHRNAEALQRFRSATTTLCSADGDDMRTAAILREYAGLLRAAGSFAEAEDVETKAMHIQVKFALVNPRDAHAAGL